MDQRFAKWDKWLDVIYNQVVELVTNRHTFSEVREMVDRNPRIQKPNLFYKFVNDTYAGYSITAVRRQIKPQKDSISFVGLLKEIIETPSVLSEKRFVEIYSREVQPSEKCGYAATAKSIFEQKFLGAYACTGHIDPNIVQLDLAGLKAHGDKLEEFTDKRVAHYDKTAPKHVPTFAELDACIDCLAKLMRKYWLLFKAIELGEDLMVLFVEDYWHEIFSQPWILSDKADTSE